MKAMSTKAQAEKWAGLSAAKKDKGESNVKFAFQIVLSKKKINKQGT